MRAAGGDGLTYPFPAAALPQERAAGSSFALLLLVGFLLVMLANVSLLVPALSPLALPQLFATAAIGLCLLETATSGRPMRMVGPEAHLLVGFAAATAISCFSALWPGYAADQTLLLLKLLAVYFLIVHTVAEPRRMRIVLWVLALGGIFPVLGALWNWRRGIFVEGDRVGWLGIFANPNDLAYGLVVLLPTVIALAVTSRGMRRILLVALGLLYVAAVFLTYSRGGLMALVLVLLLAVWRWGNAAIAFGALWLGIFATFVVPAVWGRQEAYSNLENDVTVRERMDTIRTGIRMFEANPVTGVGLGCSIIGWPLYAPADAVSHKWLHTHNTAIQLLSETGLLGTISFGGAVAGSLVRARRVARRARAERDRESHAAACAGELAIWGFLACGLSGGHLLTWFPYIAMGLVSASSVTQEARGDRAT